MKVPCKSLQVKDVRCDFYTVLKQYLILVQQATLMLMFLPLAYSLFNPDMYIFEIGFDSAFLEQYADHGDDFLSAIPDQDSGVLSALAAQTSPF